MRAFEVDEGSPAEFVARVKRELDTSGLADYADLVMNGIELIVKFRWMGSSELRYRVSERENGFRADPDGERMSPFHAPFRQAFEERLDKVLTTVGARTV